ncbi:MAG: guanylate cyclase [Eggerthellaceae bacterium]|nr:guanylate cyclase [Eggerthellaceae bacterium]
MPVALLARLSRIVPLLAVLAFIAAVVYIVMSFRYSSERAKATLIQVFTWLTAGLSVIFALITVYALFEQNVPVIELFASFLGTTLVGLGVTRICNAVFKRNHPHYGEEVAQATIINESIASRFAEAFKRALSEALKDTFKRR